MSTYTHFTCLSFALYYFFKLRGYTRHLLRVKLHWFVMIPFDNGVFYTIEWVDYRPHLLKFYARHRILYIIRTIFPYRGYMRVTKWRY